MDRFGNKVTPAKNYTLIDFVKEKLNELKNYDNIANKDSPLVSIKNFEDIHMDADLLKAVYAAGFNRPSKIQANALPLLLADPPLNLVAQSQSGTGKTAAFVLAMLTRVNKKLNYPQVICLCPTYELAIQTGEICTKLSAGITVIYAVRGEPNPSVAQITEQIIIGTPGKVMDWGIKYKWFDLSKIRVFVLDEADTMVSTQGHHDRCIRIHRKLDLSCQMIFFSATYDDEVLDFVQYMVPNPKIIRLPREQECLDNIKQYYALCRGEESKYTAIQNIYGGITIGQAIIFCNTRKCAAWLTRKLTKDGHSVAVLSGELNIVERLSILDRFRAGLEKVLVTTNVLSRGIDVTQVTLVVNFHMPILHGDEKPDYDTYLHRIGRTGRFGKHGIALNLVENENDMKLLRSFEAHFRKPIKLLNTNDSDEVHKLEH
ncbi:DEAD-box helicase Dbp80-like [Teleopsis dalmanni]|uniref:DEAD-box helicase Dbp80-like n=1 Tax=Teleopsis dalmanni TaxID=139649 RepID=UPI0018CC89AA|nr:DEAD-box helicase Dbp80-like [Teleopsis dalmanni]XP_037949585.1 DEAD-box helicase Dbp80-like [Teleopsis dalmanni]